MRLQTFCKIGINVSEISFVHGMEVSDDERSMAALKKAVEPGMIFLILHLHTVKDTAGNFLDNFSELPTGKHTSRPKVGEKLPMACASHLTIRFGRITSSNR